MITSLLVSHPLAYGLYMKKIQESFQTVWLSKESALVVPLCEHTNNTEQLHSIKQTGVFCIDKTSFLRPGHKLCVQNLPYLLKKDYFLPSI